jgi:hypothetical protein
MNPRCLAITVVALALAVGAPSVSDAADEWTSKAIKGLLPGGKESQEKTTLVGKVVAHDEKDKNGSPITSAYLEQDDGSLIPLPCTPKKDKDKGIAAKTAGKVTGDESCWKYVGQKVEIVGTAQSITKEAKRIRRLAKITGIKPL